MPTATRSDRTVSFVLCPLEERLTHNRSTAVLIPEVVSHFGYPSHHLIDWIETWQMDDGTKGGKS